MQRPPFFSKLHEIMRKFSEDSWSDFELLELIRQQDNQEAFAELFDRHWKFLYNRVYQLLKHHDDTLDICQNLFVWIWENRNSISIKSNFRTYLFVAAKYKVANLMRVGKVRTVLVEKIELDQLAANTFDSMEVKELQHLIFQLIHELPPKCREIFMMSREQGLSHLQIAQQLQLSEKTVDEQIRRALQKLRKPLNKLANLIIAL